MSGGAPKNQTTVQSSEPWAGAKPYLLDMYERGSRRPAHRFFEGDTVARSTEDQVAGRRNIRDYAYGDATRTAKSATDALNFQLNDAVNVDSNPHLRRAVDAAIRPVERQLTEQLLPNIRAGSVIDSSYGSSRQGIAEGLAMSRANEVAGDMTSRMMSAAYGQGLDAQGRALSLTPSILEAGTAPGMLLDRVGSAEQNQEQNEINARRERWDFNESAEDERLARFMSLIAGGPGGQTVNTTTPGARKSPAASVAGGAMAGFSAGGWWGAALGAFAGLLGAQ